MYAPKTYRLISVLAVIIHAFVLFEVFFRQFFHLFLGLQFIVYDHALNGIVTTNYVGHSRSHHSPLTVKKARLISVAVTSRLIGNAVVGFKPGTADLNKSLVGFKATLVLEWHSRARLQL